MDTFTTEKGRVTGAFPEPVEIAAAGPVSTTGAFIDAGGQVAGTFTDAAGNATPFATASGGGRIQAPAQTLIAGAYAFVANGTDGYLFSTGGTGTTITDAIKLAGVGTAGAVKYADIAHGALARAAG